MSGWIRQAIPIRRRVSFPSGSRSVSSARFLNRQLLDGELPEHRIMKNYMPPPYQLCDASHGWPANELIIAADSDVIAKIELSDKPPADDPEKGINPVLRRTAEFMVRACN